MTELKHYLGNLPLLAILRGITTDECTSIADALLDTQFSCMEIPLNSPNALQSIAKLAQHLPAHCLLGAGTVMTRAQVQAVHDAGGRLIVMPHANLELIRCAKALGMLCIPGVATLTEAFAALDAGADALKLFPSESVPPSVLQAWRSVLPQEIICMPVGGVKPEDMADYRQAGAYGFGLGSHLYRAGDSAAQVASRAQVYVSAWRAL